MKHVLLAILVCASSCTHLVWYGRSDDRRHVVSVIENTDGQHVRLDSVDGASFRGIGVDALAFTNSGHLAYAAQVTSGWLVIHDKNVGQVFDAIGELQLVDHHVAYTAEREGKWHVVRDNVVSEPFDTILPGSLVLSRNGRLAFAAQDEMKIYAVIDGVRSEPLDGVGLLRFSGDESHAGFVGKKRGASFVMISGKEQGPFERVTELRLGNPDLFVASTPEGPRLFVDGQPGEAFDRIAGVIDGPAYAARRMKENFVIDGAKQFGPFVSLKSELMRDAKGNLVFAAQTADSWVVVNGEDVSRGWDEVETPVISAAHVGFIGERNGRCLVMIDGEERSSWEWASSLALNGTRVAHLARRKGKTYVVLDGKELSYDVVVAGTLAFSKDGKRFGCVTGEAKTKRLFITREDGKRTPVDMEELVAALSRVGPDALLTNPDVTLLRRWVEAELEH